MPYVEIKVKNEYGETRTLKIEHLGTQTHSDILYAVTKHLYECDLIGKSVVNYYENKTLEGK